MCVCVCLRVVVCTHIVALFGGTHQSGFAPGARTRAFTACRISLRFSRCGIRVRRVQAQIYTFLCVFLALRLLRRGLALRLARMCNNFECGESNASLGHRITPLALHFYYRMRSIFPGTSVRVRQQQQPQKAMRRLSVVCVCMIFPRHAIVVRDIEVKAPLKCQHTHTLSHTSSQMYRDRLKRRTSRHASRANALLAPR